MVLMGSKSFRVEISAAGESDERARQWFICGSRKAHSHPFSRCPKCEISMDDRYPPFVNGQVFEDKPGAGSAMAASVKLAFPSSAGTHRPLFRLRYRPVRCAVDRQSLFSRIAPVYDNLNDLLSLGQHRIWKRMAVSWTGAKPGDCVLDLCCGSGDLAFLLSEKVGLDGKVTGLDFSKAQLNIAFSRQQLLSKPCYKNIEWVEGNATDLPFSQCCFDAITMGYGLRNVVDKHKAMEEMFRVLKPGAKASILDFNKSSQPLVASFQEWMIDNVVVPVASSYGLEKEYAYLKTSIRDFLTGKELEELALEVGFCSARHYEIGAGLMGNLVVTR